MKVLPVDYGVLVMSVEHVRNGFFAMALFILAVLFLFLFFDHRNIINKNAPNDPQVNEAINQARTLQKQGKLSEGLIIFEKHALQGYPDAMFHTAKSYSRGWGVAPDLEKARHYYLLAVQYGYSYRGENAYELGRLFQRSTGPDCNTVAVEWFFKSFDWNFVKASLQLGIHYEKGLGVDQNVDKAIKYYKIALRAGHEQAAIKYARLLIKGRYGITADPDKAKQLVAEAMTSLEKRVKNGSSTAAKQLGRLYRDGELVQENQQKAYEWLLISARMGNTGGMHDLAHMTLITTNNPEQQAEAIIWLQKAADRGHGGAMTALGRFHLDEQYGLKQDGAVHWFKKGVVAKHGGSMEELARLYRDGLLVEENRDEAIRLAEEGSLLGHLGSERLLKKLLETRENI